MEKKEHFRLELITPKRVILDRDVRFAVVPSAQGPLGILPGHAPVLGNLAVGVLHVRDISQKEFSAFVDKGFFMISREGVTITVEDAELGPNIDIEKAREAKEHARKIIDSLESGKHQDEARVDLLRAEARIQASQGATK